MGMINILSHLPLPVRLFEPHPDPTKPGLSDRLRSVTVAGKDHPDALPVVSRVDGDAYEAWRAANPEHSWLKDEMIKVVSDDEAKDLATSGRAFGFEPGLDTVETAGQAEGSLDHEVPHAEVDMNAHSDVPNDDSPRSQTEGFASGGIVPSPQPMDPEPPVAEPARRDDIGERPVTDPATADATARDNPDRPRSDAGVV